MNSSVQSNSYDGVERRIDHRRVAVDRREMVRFEMDKEPRRSGNDRRGPLSVWAGRDKF